MLHTAIVHALTMEKVSAQIRHLSLSSRNPSAHISISLHLPFNRRAQPVSRYRFVGRNVSLFDPRVQLHFHLLDFSLISGLDFVGGQSIDPSACICCSNRQVCVRPSFLVDIKFLHRSLHELKKRFLPPVPSSARFHHRLVPVDEMSLVLCESYLHPLGSPSCRCLSQTVELELGSSGRVSVSPTIPRLPSSADAVRRKSSQTS